MRRQRIEFDGAIYHVIQRSSNKEAILGSDSDKICFLEVLGKTKAGFQLFGYVLMVK